MVLICISLIIGYAEHLVMYLLFVCISGEDCSQPLNACLVRSLPVGLWHEYTPLLFAH